MLKPGINHVTNTDYHADKEYISSSGLKLLNKDAEQFYNEIVLGNRVSISKPAFDEGSYVHSLILEPHMVNEEFAFYPEMRKQGKDFEAFKLQNQGKIIISKPQKVRCDRAVRFYNERPEAVELVKGGFPEHTICGEIDGMKLKIRTDYINVKEGYIADVKTSGYPVDKESFKMTINQFQYDLSAGLYCMIAEQHYGKPFDFYYIVLGKKDDVCEVFKTSEKTMRTGRDNTMKAIKKYKKCVETGKWINETKAAKPVLSDYEILEI